jgi:hypothetical protein
MDVTAAKHLVAEGEKQVPNVTNETPAAVMQR